MITKRTQLRRRSELNVEHQLRDVAVIIAEEAETGRNEAIGIKSQDRDGLRIVTEGRMDDRCSSRVECKVQVWNIVLDEHSVRCEWAEKRSVGMVGDRRLAKDLAIQAIVLLAIVDVPL